MPGLACSVGCCVASKARFAGSVSTSFACGVRPSGTPISTRYSTYSPCTAIVSSLPFSSMPVDSTSLTTTGGATVKLAVSLSV